MVETEQDVLDAEAEVGNEYASRLAFRRGPSGYGNARQAMFAFEHHLLAAAGPLDVGDGVMVGAKHSVAAIAHRKIANDGRTGIKHNDFDTRALR